ncbi:MAG TPA: hypothetical protein VFU22_15835 [Roseiflexaceae bacterium]|nr:hypothetical protein [Roseiflexaceae bacterium]
MVAILIQLAIAAIWGALLALHTQRLFRLAYARVEAGTPDQQLRQRMQRAWWWLGREEFWRKVQADTCRCLEITLMLFLLAWTV